MRVVRDLSYFQSKEWRSAASSAVVGITIGNFDGMHMGHQALFDSLSRELDGVPNTRRVLVTFAPHPRRFFSGRSKYELDRDPAFGSLLSIRDKLCFARDAGFDAVYFIRFSESFAALEPKQFVENYLVRGIGASVVVVGHDWCFGRGRAGTPDRLRELADESGFRVVVFPPVLVGEERVGSRLLKQLVEAGDMGLARSYLGRNFSLTSFVREGDKRGRMLGFPTANLEFVGRSLPANGVYATIARVQGREYHSVTNVGVRPTFESVRKVVEVHLFADSNLNLYGERLTVEFVQRLREERRFSGVEELKAAIGNDVTLARELLSRRPR